jgi:L-alanine-DL-glutamate epimerase-like enolase superfamily enzyme
MTPLDAIRSIETFVISVPRDEPYLGPLRAGEAINPRGYFVRAGNRTIYPTTDMSVLIKITGESGRIGWGESFGVAAPEALKVITDTLLAPVVLGRDPGDPIVIHEDLYDLMRVRGFVTGHYTDALAGVDIAIWDLYGKSIGRPLAQLLGGQRRQEIPAYVSGLPRATVRERCDLAVEWARRGFRGIKFAVAVSDEGGIVGEMAALREAVGPDIHLMVDLHWKFGAAEAIGLIRRLEAHGLFFAEAPCEPEDVAGQRRVADAIATPLALGEEWSTAFTVRDRLLAGGLSILQPEMGHTGVSEFVAIARLAQAFHVEVMPHATIGTGIFMAASLQASAALKRVRYHEYQHSIFDRNLAFVTGDMGCADGHFRLPTGPGLGVEPSAAVFDHVVG